MGPLWPYQIKKEVYRELATSAKCGKKIYEFFKASDSDRSLIWVVCWWGSVYCNKAHTTTHSPFRLVRFLIGIALTIDGYPSPRLFVTT